MFKVLVLQYLYNVSGDQLEYQIRDRYSFCRFLGLPLRIIPDAKTKDHTAVDNTYKLIREYKVISEEVMTSRY